MYWSELIKRIQSRIGDTFYIEPRRATHTNIFRQNLNIPDSQIIQALPGPAVFRRYFPPLLPMATDTIFHSSYYRLALNTSVINIITVYDFTYELFRSGLRRFIHSLQKKVAILNADAVICISDYTKSDLLRLYPSVRTGNIHVIHLGIGDEFHVINTSVRAFPELDDGMKSIVFVGDRYRYKNFEAAIEAVRRLDGARLVVVGGGSLSPAEKIRLDQRLPGRYTTYLGLSSRQLNQLYNKAFCLLYPSSYEGFGLPVGEAMKAGCPVVTLNRSSIPEIAGHAAVMLNQAGSEEIEAGIKKLEENAFRKEVTLRGLRQAEKFSWDRTFDDTFRLYQDLMGKKKD